MESVARTVLIDTDVIIDFLKGKGKGVKLFEEIITLYSPATTYINYFELICGVRNDEEYAHVENCLSGFSIFSLDRESAEKAARIYQDLKGKKKLIDIRDILVSGIAFTHHCEIATNNERDFGRIDDVKLFRL